MRVAQDTGSAVDVEALIKGPLPPKPKSYVYHGPEPLNREFKPKDLVEKFFTPEACYYDRNHSVVPPKFDQKLVPRESNVVSDGLVNSEHTTSQNNAGPEVDGQSSRDGRSELSSFTVCDDHIIRIESSLLPAPVSVSVRQLATDFCSKSVVCVLQCAGNRRHTMRTQLKEVEGIDWNDGALMNGRWEGPLVRDVLLHAFREQNKEAELFDSDRNKHWNVQFDCRMVDCQDDSYYGVSVPLSRVMDAEMLGMLALKLNGSPISPPHGGPVRVMLPGVCGARAVKWVSHIVVSPEESPNFYQQRDYKVLPPQANSDNKHVLLPHFPSMLSLPVNSAVMVPESDSVVKASPEDDTIVVRGWASPGGDDGPVEKVEVSIDEGQTWVTATLNSNPPPSRWSWALWEAKVAVPRPARPGMMISPPASVASASPVLSASSSSPSSPQVGTASCGTAGPGAGADGQRSVIKKIWSRASDRVSTQQRRTDWNLRGVAYAGYGEARDVSVEFSK